MSIRVKIYVRPFGNDNTGDGTQIRPFRTVLRALRAVPIIDTGDMRFIIDNTGCVDTDQIIFPPFISGQELATDWGGGTDFASFYSEGYVTVQAEPIMLDLLNDGTTTFTPDDYSGLGKVQDTSKAWDVDQFKGKWLVGSGVLEQAPIIGNTADTLDTALALTDHAPTAPIRIFDLSAEMNGNVIVSGVRAPIVFNGQKINQPGNYTRGLNVKGCVRFHAWLCDLKNPDVRSCDEASIFAYIHGEGGGNTTDIVFNGTISLGGYIVDCSPDMTEGFITISGAVIENCPMLQSFGPSASGQVANCEWRKKAFAFGGGAISVMNLLVDNVAGDAVVANGPGALDLSSVGTGPNVGGIGLHALNGAQVRVHGDVNPTGAAGDLKVGQNPVRTWPDFRNIAPVGNEIDQTPGTGDGSRVWE